MTTRYPNLFAPLDRGRLKLKNRTVFPGHQTLLSEDGIVGERMRGYYAERARGGVGAIVVEGAAVHDTTVKFPNYLYAHDPRIVPSLDRLAVALRPYDCKAILQLAHSGSRMSSHDSRLALWAPSDVRSAISPEIPHAMTRDDIAELLAGYERAARHVAESAIAGVEIHAAHEYLLGQFLSPLNNRRQDEYGGSLENRARLLIDVVQLVRRVAGDRVVGVRLNGSDLTAGGLEVADYVQVARLLDATGALDYVSVTAGTSRDNHLIVPPMDVRQGVFVDYAAAIRSAVSLPVFAVGRIKHPSHAEQVLADGKADVVAIARALIADPFWVQKAATEPTRIRPCIGCNQGCFGYLYTNRPITCTVNPAVGREGALGSGTETATAARRRVLVIGAGPAGMEAAIAAAERGHQVVLAEACGEVGGQVRIASLHPSRRDLAEIIDHQRAELDRLGVELRLNTRLDAAGVRALHADAVIVATGSAPPLRPLPTDGSVPVLSPAQALSDPSRWKGRVVTIVDGVGHFPAYAPADALVDAGAEVRIVTSKLYAGTALDQATNVTMLKRLGAKQVRIDAQTAVREVRDGHVLAVHVFSGEEISFACDAVVAALGNVADDALARALAGQAELPRRTLIGDCMAPRTMLEAIREGRMAGRSV